MKGVVFNEFMEMVETRMGPETWQRITAEAGLPNQGGYAAGGTYDHVELMHLVQTLSNVTGSSTQALINMFGEHLFQRFAGMYRPIFEAAPTVFDFLYRIDDLIHVRVRQLYPDAELPTLSCESESRDEMTILYCSPRNLGDLAEGLIKGCIRHYGEAIQLTRTNLPQSGNRHRVRFDLHRLARSSQA